MVTKNRGLGDVGEKAVGVFLVKHGFSILERNYLRKWGEIDIIAKKSQRLHFVEVKTTTADASPESIRPEENIHREKFQRMVRTIHGYLAEHRYGGEWQIDAAIVYIDNSKNTAKIKMLWNLIFS